MADAKRTIEVPIFDRTVSDELSFKGQRATTGRHRIHPYPAMMHHLVVDALVKEYSRPDDLVFDPFCGSGSVLWGASVLNRRSVGYDINPLALLIAKAKTEEYKESSFLREIRGIEKTVTTTTSVDIPDINNMSFWYEDAVTEELGRIRHVLLSNSFRYAAFFTVCFAYQCRRNSYTRQQEFKRYRRKDLRSTHSNGAVIASYMAQIQKLIPSFIGDEKTDSRCKLRLANSEAGYIEDEPFDLLLTSPPYGDHSTTVAYGQFSSFGNDWTQGLNPFNTIDYSVDREGLGKRSSLSRDLADYCVLSQTLSQVSEVRTDRAKDVAYFFNGYAKSLRQLVKRLQPGGFACFVVGNRTVAGIEIPLDQITAEILDRIGLSFVEIRTREITNKVMPLENSPSNVAGQRKRTMTKEYVVVFRNNSPCIDP